jgi:hypothetical protein
MPGDPIIYTHDSFLFFIEGEALKQKSVISPPATMMKAACSWIFFGGIIVNSQLLSNSYKRDNLKQEKANKREIFYAFLTLSTGRMCNT